MSPRKLNEHVESELFNKEKRVVPAPPRQEPRIIKEGEQPKKPTPPPSRYLKEGDEPPRQEPFNKEKRVTIDPEKVIKTTPIIRKESVLGLVEDKPVKKKRPYYRKKYNKPTPVEVVIPEPVNQYLFIKGLLVGSVLTAIICHIIYSI